MGVVIGEALAMAVAFALESIMEVDEVLPPEQLPDGSIKVTFVTTGLHPSTAKIKTAVWAIAGLPVQAVDSVTIEELQKGTFLTRYRITLILRPVRQALKRGEGLGILGVLTGEKVRYVGTD